MREKIAAWAFLAHFYKGIEKILKRISRFYAVPLPGERTVFAIIKNAKNVNPSETGDPDSLRSGD
ncbi:MAG: hypothetical protein B6245_16025 [Desulfobacteraceae bacterium 4572_88]|nr:MAG: hypothetical protein B6245_16025 [Desulfobacteraceae bacterium 4572_88]